MENNNQTTTQQLENAINTLLDAYEVLQEENNEKDLTIQTLQDKIQSLEDNIENIEDDNGKQNSTLGSMLGKIESILGGNKTELSTITSAASTDQSTLTFEDNKTEEIDAINIDDISVNPERTEKNGFDEDRMNKLLGGFN